MPRAKKPGSGGSERARRLRLARLDIERRGYQASLMAFAQSAWKVVEPQTVFVPNWHHELVAEYLTLVKTGEIRRLIINMPPQHTKSRLVTVIWPCWVWTDMPGAAFIFDSYSHKLSVEKHSIERRTILESEWYTEHWPGVEIAEGENRQDEYHNTERGFMFATSTNASVTGQGADFIVPDDPTNPEQALSDAERTSSNRFFDQSLYTRQRDPQTSRFVIIMQRLHDDDLTGHMLAEKKDPPWHILDLQAEAEERTIFSFPISGREKVREVGDLLWPARFDQTVLNDFKRTLGTWAFSAQYQQRPTPKGGGIWKRDWWHYWGGPCPRCGGTVHGLPLEFNDILQSWDMTFVDTEGSDFVAGQVWARRGGDIFLLDRVYDRMNFPATLMAVQGMSAKWPSALGKLVENKANGPAVIATLRHTVMGLIEVEPEGGKIARAHAMAPVIEAGNCYIPYPLMDGYAWCHDFLENCTAFPKGAKDDDVDAASQGLRRLSGFGLPGEGYEQYLRAAAAERQKRQQTVRRVVVAGGNA